MGLIDMTGEKCGRLTVLERAENDKHGNAMWKCKCECGNIIITLGYQLRSGHTKSCGCLQKDIVRKMNTKHGYSKTRIYRIWDAMKGRCLNPNNDAYENYGGRGIEICEEWMDPVNFIEWAYDNGYNDNLTIERIDIDGNYEPSNCTWVTRAEQNRNTSRNITVEVDGKEYGLAQLARELGRNRSTLYQWYHKEGLRGKGLVERAKEDD